MVNIIFFKLQFFSLFGHLSSSQKKDKCGVCETVNCRALFGLILFFWLRATQMSERDENWHGPHALSHLQCKNVDFCEHFSFFIYCLPGEKKGNFIYFIFSTVFLNLVFTR